MMSDVAKLSRNCSAGFAWSLPDAGPERAEGPASPPVRSESGISVLIRPVGNVSFDGADRPVGL